MAERQEKPLLFTRMRGRDGSTTYTNDLPLDKFREAWNIDLYRTTFANKRGGTSNYAITPVAPLFGLDRGVVNLATHLPSNDLRAIELWFSDGRFRVFRLNASPDTATAQTLPTTASLSGAWHTQSFNGKFFIGIVNGASRLLVWDGSAVRFAGMGTPSAPTAANTGAGTYAATQRYYRERRLVLSGTTILRMGEASPSVAFTPSGAGTAARVTKSATLGEGETHWRVEVSLDDAVWYLLSSPIAVATTTYDDSAATTSYSTNDAAPLAGRYTNWSEITLVASDENRLIGAVDASGSFPSRVWFSPVLGSTSAAFADDEYVPDTVEQKNYLEINHKNGTFITGLSRPFAGAFWVFESDEIHRLVPTNLDTAPFKRFALGAGVGALRQDVIIHAVDESGQPAMYFLSHTGPYRITAGLGLQYLGDDIKDVWDTVNYSYLYGRVGKPHGVYYREKGQIWWWLPVEGSATCNRRIKFQIDRGFVERPGIVRGGWSVDDGESTEANQSVMFSNTPGASMSIDQRPYICTDSTTTPVLKCDTAATSDNGTTFQAYATLPHRHYAGMDKQCQVTGAAAHATTEGSPTLRLTLDKNFGEETRDDDAIFEAASEDQTRRLVAFEGAELIEANTVSATIGDAEATAETWTIDALLLHIEPRSSVTP